MTPSLLETARGRFQLAVAAAGETVVWRFALEGHVVELRFAGPALVDAIVPALSHLAVQNQEPPELTVLLWDTASTGVSFPLDAEDRLEIPAWRRKGPWGEVGTSGDRVIHQPYEDVLGILGDGVAVHWVADAKALPYYERSAPLLHLLHWWLEGHGLHMLHAAAVGRADGGVLVVGPTGTGKSTTAAACLGSSILYASDDYTLVGTKPDLHAVSLYRTAKVEREHELGLALRLPRPAPVPGEKALYYLEDGLVAGFPLRALILPKVGTGKHPHITRLPSGVAVLAALAPSSVLQLPGAGTRVLKVMRQLCENVPSYVLELGSDLEGVPGVIEELLAA